MCIRWFCDGVNQLNFEHMPELTWQYGYYGALVLMAAVGGTLAFLFRRFGWW